MQFKVKLLLEVVKIPMTHPCAHRDFLFTVFIFMFTLAPGRKQSSNMMFVLLYYLLVRKDRRYSLKKQNITHQGV